MNQPSAISRQPSANPWSGPADAKLLRFALAVRMHHIVATQPGLQREHCQDRQRGEAQFRIAQSRPRQRPQNHEGGQRHVETIHFKSLVHREGFEPSYLRGGADLQSAGFNHSPTCAELQNSSALPACPAFLADMHATEDRSGGLFDLMPSKVTNRKAREYASHANTTLGKFPYGVPLEKSVKPPRRISCLPEPMLELAKGFEPLTL